MIAIIFIHAFIINFFTLVVLDNHRWYHATHVHTGAISISYGEEFT